MPQVTEKLLEAEEKKLRVLKAEIEASKHIDATKDSSKVSVIVLHAPTEYLVSGVMKIISFTLYRACH